MKKQDREEICVVSSNIENISHWAWGCGYVSTAGSSGLSQVSGTSHWILLTTIPAILWYWGQCFPVLKDLPLPRAWAPTVPQEQTCQRGHCCCDLGKLFCVSVEAPMAPHNQGRAQELQYLPRSCTLPWVSGLQLGTQPARWGMFEARPLRQTSAFNKVPQDF